jgi:hypothetical protein
MRYALQLLMVVFYFSFGINSVTATSDPILLWHFDESSGTTAHDSAGPYNSPVYGGATWTPGKSNNALYFDGANDYVRGPAISLNSFSVAFWVKTTMSPLSSTGWWNGNGMVDAETREYVNDWGTSLIDNGKVAFGVGNYYPEPTITIKSTTLVNDGVWHFITGTRDRLTGQLLLYVDGLLEAQGIGGRNALNSIQFIGVGNNSSDVLDNDEWFQGTIDEVMIYDRVLLPTEISTMVPEPATMALLALGGLLLRKRTR